MAKAFYLKLAWANVRRNKLTYLPYIIATGVISGVILLIAGLMFSDGLNNLPSGKTAAAMFNMGLVVFCIFAFFFMVYINNFLIGRRKKEFALYGILGLQKRDVGRVLVLENLITLSAGVLCGILIALVFGKLLFLILLKIMRTAVGSSFIISPFAYVISLLVFVAVFIVTSLINLRQIRISSPIELLHSEKKGEVKSPLMIPFTIFGLIAICGAYYFAWSIDSPHIALGAFFLLVILVIFATYTLFTSGSIALLKLLRANKRMYYKLNNFVSISGMLHRMKQNARSLATICILSTMLIVTVSGTLALYLGQEEMIAGSHPFDVTISVDENNGEAAICDFDKAILVLADEYDVTISADKSKLIYELPENIEFNSNYVSPEAKIIDVPNLIWINGIFMFDVDGTQHNCLAFVDGLRELHRATFNEGFNASDVFSMRQEGYALYGGLLFMGVFFGLLFLAVTVLIIYFKQITEGYEDKERFAILQKVGMDDAQVKATINRQVLWMFFIPLFTTVLHTVFASRIMAQMLRVFMVYDWGMVLACILGVCLIFVLLYLIVYRLTARVYYKIVKW
ncbi:MAG: ABC transporter permease [Clostridia bacterium]